MRPDRRRHAPVLTLSLALGLTLAPDAFARDLVLTGTEEEGYARIVAEWSDDSETPPPITARLEGPVLILRFDEAVEIDLDKLKSDLPSYVAVGRETEPGREARLALSRSYRLHVSSSLDLFAIDLVPEAVSADPADIVSPLVEAQRLAAIAAAEAAREAETASIPDPLPVDIRAATAPNRATIGFYWPEEIGYEVNIDPGVIELRFDRRGETDISELRQRLPETITGLETENTDRTFVARISASDGARFTHSQDGDTVTVSVLPAGSDEDVLVPESLLALAASLPVDLIDPPSRRPVRRDDPSPDPVASLEGPVDDLAISRAFTPAPRIVEREIAPRNWNEAVPPSGQVPVTALRSGGAMDIRVGFGDVVPAAVFQRYGDLWIVFPVDGNFDLSGASTLRGAQAVTTRGGLALRMPLEGQPMISVVPEGNDWIIELDGRGPVAQRLLRPARVAGPGGSRIKTDIPELGTLITLDDPIIGDQLHVATAFGPASALSSGLNFIEADFLSSAHGLAIALKADDLAVRQIEGSVVVERPEGLALSTWGVETQALTASALSPAFIDFETWRGGSAEDFSALQSARSRDAAMADLKAWGGRDAVLSLARFYLAWNMGPEALGPLQIVAEEDPAFTSDAQFLGLRAAANIMAGRYSEALEDLEKSSVRSDPAAAAWRGFTHSRRGDWRKARDAFLEAGPMVDAYGAPWADRFHAEAARTLHNLGDLGLAARRADAALAGDDPFALGLAALVKADIQRANGNTDAALASLKRLDAHSWEEIRIRARLRETMLLLERGDISPLEAADRLEALRYRWRGDALELEIVDAVSDVYFKLGRFRESLNASQKAVQRFPDLPGSRDMRIAQQDRFKTMFLEGDADTLDPIQALAMFYEFQDLTPIGPDGDRMVRQLSGRLVAFDLLEPAADLLSYQVENRNLIGASRAKIAADLAAIYLMDKRPEDALRVLNMSRSIGLPDELRQERRLLEAGAHMEMNRFGHAAELLESLETTDARNLLAEVHWRARDWSKAALALADTLPEPGAVTPADHGSIIRTAVAHRLAGEAAALTALRGRYGDVMAQTTHADTFDLISGTTDVSGTQLSQAVRRLADTRTADAFSAQLKQRFSDS